jgi:hypothetical protein
VTTPADTTVARRWAIVVALLAALVHANALANGFTMDDGSIVVSNPLVRSLGGVWRAFGHTYWPNTLIGQYRPLVIAGFAIDWAVSGGSPLWFHLVNVAWHVVASLLVLRLARALLPERGAIVAAVLFAVHPVHVEAIANVVGRCELMAAVFLLAGFLAHRAGRLTAIGWYALALLSKESGIVLLGLGAIHDLLLTDDWRAALRSRWRIYAGYLATAAVYALILSRIFRGETRLVAPSPTWIGTTTTERWLTMLRVVPEYLRLMLAPWQLGVDYTPQTIPLETHVTPFVVFGAVLLAVLAAVAWLARRRAPVVTFGMLWFAVAISPVSNVLFASGIVLAERTLYVPSVGAMLVVGWVAAWFAARRAAAVRPVGLVTAAMVVGWSARDWTRTPIWHDNKSLAIAWLETQPESYRGHAWAASTLSYVNDWAGSAREAEQARALFPRDPGPYLVGAEAELALHDGPRALALIDSATALAPTDAAPWVRMARARAYLGDWRGVIAPAREAYRLNRRAIAVITLQVSAAQHLGDFGLADRAFREGLADHPTDRNLHLGYAAMLRAKGDTASAATQSALAAASPPSDPDDDPANEPGP